jgi:tripartite ATP-independent transporter DctM subunit
MSIPLFIFMGTIAFHCGIVSDIFEAIRRWIGFLPVGLAASGILAATAFGAVTGSTAAATATMATTVIPELEKSGYNQTFAAGTMAAAGGFAAIIPPSVFLIVFAVLADQSIGELFIAVIGPGVLTSILFCLYAILASTFIKDLGPRQPPATWKERFQSLPAALPVAALFIIVIGSIFAGFATPTESAALGVVGVLLISACMRRLTKQNILNAFREGAKMSAAIFLLFIGGWLMARLLVTTGTTKHMVNWFVGMEMSYNMFIFVLFILYLILGCLLESISILILTIPFVYPITLQYGMDTLWFGVFVTMMMVMAGISPPVGLNIFIVRSICPHISIFSIYKGAFPYLFLMTASIVAMVIWPDLALFLVKKMFTTY